MKFELHLTCTKDIDKLAIDFSDGTSVIQSSPNKTKDELDLDSEFGEISQKIVEKPQIHQRKRETNIAGELQNLNI